MRTETTAVNPFALMMDPAGVRAMIDRSEALGRLSQRQCHPLINVPYDAEWRRAMVPVYVKRAVRE